MIDRFCSNSLKRLWEFILNGRSLIEDKVFKIQSPVFRFSCFSEQECKLMHSELLSKFNLDTPEQFNKKPGIGSMVQAIENKEGNGLLVTVA
ncbi:MAG: hypothetical protein AAGK97_18475 [Bacteroidota bacterium]